MKARPLLFSAPMVRALLAGKKTQTRRIVKPQPPIGTGALRDIPHENRWWAAYAEKDSVGTTYRPLGSDQQHDWRCPYGMAGDLLWVRETFQPLFADGFDHNSCPVPDWGTGYGYAPRYMATEDAIEWIDGDDNITDRCKPAIHMPRWASRITLRITDVRVERLQEISEADAIAEGRSLTPGDARGYFPETWEAINGADSWAANPWVWVICFDTMLANVDQVIRNLEAAA